MSPGWWRSKGESPRTAEPSADGRLAGSGPEGTPAATGKRSSEGSGHPVLSETPDAKGATAGGSREHLVGARAVRLGAEHHPEVTLLSDLNSVIDYTGGSLTDRVILGCHQDSNYIYTHTFPFKIQPREHSWGLPERREWKSQRFSVLGGNGSHQFSPPIPVRPPPCH